MIPILKNFIEKRARALGFIHPKDIKRRDYSQDSRLNFDWVAGRTSRNDKIERSLAKERDRARQLATRNPYGKKFIAQCKANIVGPNGMPVKVRSTDPTGTLDKRANAMIKEAWDEWCKPENCTVTGRLSFANVLSLIAGDEPKSGEVIARKVRGLDNQFKFAIQLIEPDCLDEMFHRKFDDGSSIRMGVEQDRWKRRTAYYLRKDNPNDSFARGFIRERIPAADIVHKFVPVEVNDVRGFPWFEASTEDMHMLEGYDEAALVAARASAAKMGFYKPTLDGSGHFTAEQDANGNLVQDTSPGQWEILPPGYEPVVVDPTYPHDQYPQFVKARLRRIASGLLVSYESLANDRESVNYSSIRAGVLEERDIWKMLQNEMILNFCEPIFADWLMWQLVTKNINLPIDKFAKFNKPKFIGRGWAWVDPQKDVAASVLALENNLTTHSRIAMEGGDDFEEICEGAEDDVETAREYSRDLHSAKERERADTLGVASRAGFVTPTMEDEEKIRKNLGLPPLSKEAKEAWAKDKVRRPITLQNDEGFDNAQTALKAKPPAPKPSGE
jgi:lambda family phage portal protein